MMKQEHEKLSNLLDEFSGSEDEVKTLDELLIDVNQRNTVGRYQLIGDAMRNELAPNLKQDFAAEMRVLIDREQSYSEIREPLQTSDQRADPSAFWSWLLKPVAGFAVAAAVAVVTVISLQSDPALDTSNQVAATETSQDKIDRLASTPVISRDVRTVSTATRSASNDAQGSTWNVKRNEAEAQSTLNRYLINHNEFANSMSGIIPQARVVGFDGQNEVGR